MALQLLPLLLGGYAAKLGIDRGLAGRDRTALSEGLASAFGGAEDQSQAGPVGQARAPGSASTYGIPTAAQPPGVPQGLPTAGPSRAPVQAQAPTQGQSLGQVGPGMQVNPNGSIGQQPQQAGLFPNAGINDPQAMLQKAAALFALPGGDAIGQDMIKDAYSFAQRNQEQQRGFTQADQAQQAQFGQRNIEQQSRFGQQDSLQENQQEYLSGQADINRAADLSEFNRTRTETERHNRQLENISLASKGYVIGPDGNPTQSPEALAAAQAQGELGTVPGGFSRHLDTDGTTYLRAEPGSKPYNEAVEEISTFEQSLRDIDLQIQSIKETSSNALGTDAASQNARYGSIVSSIAALRNLGVIQKDEAERLEGAIPNPADLTSHMRLDSSMIAAYEELGRQFQTKLKTSNQKYSHWGLGSELASATPEQIRELNSRAQMEAAASESGLTIDATPQAAPVNSPFKPSIPSQDEVNAMGGLFPQGRRLSGTGGLDIEAINRAGRQ